MDAVEQKQQQVNLLKMQVERAEADFNATKIQIQ